MDMAVKIDASPESNEGLASVFKDDIDLCFDVSDLLQYWRQNRAPTGIQRVQTKVILSVEKNVRYRAIAMIYPYGFWKAIDLDLLTTAMVLSQTGYDIEDEAWRNAIKEIDSFMNNSDYAGFTEKSVLVNLGTSWWIPNYINAVSELKEGFGAKYVPFIHDLIPMKVPEHCSPELVCEFTQWAYAILLQADAIIVNSSQTAKDVKDAAWSIHGLKIDPVVCRLDAAPEFTQKHSKISAVTSRATARPYVLFVSTIESRKNHLFIFDAWIELCRTHGIDNIPNLICVGKLGWLVESAMSRYNNSSILKSKVTILSNVGDNDLSYLYKCCLFTLYNSHYEGWGLPITESLFYGKVPLIPRNTSLTEAGGEFAEYFLSGSLDSFIMAIQHLIFNSEYRLEREKIVLSYQCRTWNEISNGIIEVAVQASLHQTRMSELHSIMPGILYKFAANIDPVVSHDNLKGYLLRYGSNWHKPEDWGVWASDSEAQIHAYVAGLSTDALLYLQLKAHSADQEIKISINNSRPVAVEIGGNNNLCFRIHNHDATSSGIRVSIVIISNGVKDLSKFTDSDNRMIGVGVSSLLLCAQDDLHSRLSYVENFGRINMHPYIF